MSDGLREVHGERIVSTTAGESKLTILLPVQFMTQLFILTEKSSLKRSPDSVRELERKGGNKIKSRLFLEINLSIPNLEILLP
jgi:hypothetical protein